MKCKNCSIKIDNPKFCGSSCAATYNNSRRKLSEKSKEKISTSIKRAHAEGRLSCNFPSQKGKTWKKPKNESWVAYKRSCAFYIPYHILHKIKGSHLVEKYGWFHLTKNPYGVSRDHMFSVKAGWDRKIDPSIIGHLANCEIIFNCHNKAKSSKCSITYEELLERIASW